MLGLDGLGYIIIYAGLLMWLSMDGFRTLYEMWHIKVWATLGRGILGEEKLLIGQGRWDMKQWGTMGMAADGALIVRMAVYHG